MGMDTLKFLELIIIQNELGGNLALAYRFSDPDGVRTGKSGYSFGRCQFDLINNPTARQVLKDCGFHQVEIEALVEQTATPSQMQQNNARLAKQSWVVDQWDQAEMGAIARHVRCVLATTGLKVSGERAFLHLCDYHNQFYLSPKGRCVRHMQGLGREVEGEDIRQYKLLTAWGRKRPDDVERRYRNIEQTYQVGSLVDHSRVEEIKRNHRRADG